MHVQIGGGLRVIVYLGRSTAESRRASYGAPRAGCAGPPHDRRRQRSRISKCPALRPIMPTSAVGRLGLPCIPCGDNGARIVAPNARVSGVNPATDQRPPCVFDLASRAYRHAIAAPFG
jgi:hypothetical protein